MATTLPDELASLLNMLGFQWPNVDEDRLRAMAGQFKQVAGEVDAAKSKHESSASMLAENNAGQAIDAFVAHSGTASLNLDHLKTACGVIAGVLDALADVVVVAKTAVIAQLVALAAEIAAAAAASIVTFGLSDAADLAATAAARVSVRGILDELEKQVESYLVQVAQNAVFSALSGALENLTSQAVGDYLGTSQGLSLSQAADAGLQSGEQALDSAAKSWTSPGGITQNLTSQAAASIQSRDSNHAAEPTGMGESV
jgi:uncharacterized protein YukE